MIFAVIVFLVVVVGDGLDLVDDLFSIFYRYFFSSVIARPGLGRNAGRKSKWLAASFELSSLAAIIKYSIVTPFLLPIMHDGETCISRETIRLHAWCLPTSFYFIFTSTSSSPHFQSRRCASSIWIAYRSRVSLPPRHHLSSSTTTHTFQEQKLTWTKQNNNFSTRTDKQKQAHFTLLSIWLLHLLLRPATQSPRLLI